MAQRRSGAAWPARVYAHTAFIACLCLQRFGLHFGDSSLSLSVPVLFGLTGLMLLTGRARIATDVAGLFLAFALWATLSAWGGALWPDPRVGFSVLSLLEVLSVYATLMVRPTDDFDSGAVLRVFLAYARVCAALGIIEFLLQFVGIQLFAFGPLVPGLQPFLIEQDYAFDSVLAYGSDIHRSNGFVLLEPSIFSQLLAIAIVVDCFVLGRRRYLPLYAIAYMTSYSGTGLLALAAAMAFQATLSGRNFGRVLTVLIIGAGVGVLFALLVPDQFEIFLGRFGEIGSEGTSGNARFLGLAGQVRQFAGETRALLGYGPGATMRSQFYMPGSGNAFLHLFVDYGWVGVVLFAAFLIRAVWHRRVAGISIVLLATFQFGGGYMLFTPFTLLLVTLGIWASARPAA